jgi:hypothetical protein
LLKKSTELLFAPVQSRQSRQARKAVARHALPDEPHDYDPGFLDVKDKQFEVEQNKHGEDIEARFRCSRSAPETLH